MLNAILTNPVSAVNPLSVIGGIVGVVTCLLAIFTFFFARMTSAKESGILIAKIEQCVKGIERIESDMRRENIKQDELMSKLNHKVDEHSRLIAALQTEMRIHSSSGGK